MQLGKMKMIIVMAVLFAMVTVVQADSTDGWKGYGLYNISNGMIEIAEEDVNIEVQGNKLNYSGEFLLKNKTNSDARVSIGMPANGIEKITLMEKGYFLKWKKRSLESLQNEFNITNGLPQENSWYVFNLKLSPGETRVVNLKLDALQQSNEFNQYTFGYFGDRNSGFANEVKKSKLHIKIDDYQAYNIMSLSGLNPQQIGKTGDVILEADGTSTEKIVINHQNITENAINQLMKSPLHKPREIATAFMNMDYNKASQSCDEYLNNLKDSQISKDQILFVKAESLRRLQKYDKYLSIAETLDYRSLYPVELKNKILFDRMSIYIDQQNQSKIDELTSEMYLLAEDSAQFLVAWMEDNNLFNPEAITASKQSNVFQPNKQSMFKGQSKLSLWYDKAIQYKYTPVIMLAVGLLLGFLLPKIKFGGRRRRPKYIYRM